MTPIRPSERTRYPADWTAISARIRFERADGRCECEGECGARSNHRVSDHCMAEHGKLHPLTGKPVWLTVAHLNHTLEDCRDENLRAMCQACHLSYDRGHHAETRRRRANNPDLFEGEPNR